MSVENRKHGALRAALALGGESGPGARPMEREWVVSLRAQCRVARFPFFFKQWGGVSKKT